MERHKSNNSKTYLSKFDLANYKSTKQHRHFQNIICFSIPRNRADSHFKIKMVSVLVTLLNCASIKTSNCLKVNGYYNTALYAYLKIPKSGFE